MPRCRLDLAGLAGPDLQKRGYLAYCFQRSDRDWTYYQDLNLKSHLEAEAVDDEVSSAPVQSKTMAVRQHGLGDESPIQQSRVWGSMAAVGPLGLRVKAAH